MIKKIISILALFCVIASLSGCNLYNRDHLSIYNPDRITKKWFGTYVEPGNSPVEPEKFKGYHTGVDFETFEDEQNIDVPVYAICDGPIARKVIAQGYGGVVAQSCIINNEKVTVVYGHLDILSVTNDAQEVLTFGDFIGNLGEGFTNQTDHERKHLHLSIHKGIEVNLLGYVQTPEELSEWIDPLDILTLKI